MRKKWQLFHATDFHSLMYPCFIVYQILGLLPYNISASIIQTSRRRYILSTFFICIFCISELLIVRNIIVTQTQVNFKDETYTLEAISLFILGGFTVIITYMLSGSRMHVLQAMLKISFRLPPKSYQKLSRWIHVKDILGTFFLIVREYIFYVKNQNLQMTVLSIYIFLSVFHTNMQYVNCVCVLKTCFKRINDNLLHIQKIVVNDEPYAPNLIRHTQKNQVLLTKLKTLKKQHFTLSDTVQMLNVIFSLQLLASTTLTFTEVTFELYNHIVRWYGELSILQDATDAMVFLLSMGYELSKLILIVWTCETNKNQAFEVGIILHDVLNRTNNEQIKEEVEKNII